MNQFKKAKQLKNETGQSLESITDLKTAGVSQNYKNFESSVASITSVDQSENSIKIPNSDFDTLETQTQLTRDSTTIAPLTTEAVIVEAKDQISISPKDLPNFTASSQDNVISKIPETADKPLSITDQKSNDVIRSEVIPSIYTNPIEDKNISSAIIPKSQEATITKHSKTSKKSVPNIFSPKGEAKSMRKSLVLKPSSVKIAEDYCVKNGGSFNELIQTLLDNFINEYEL